MVNTCAGERQDPVEKQFNSKKPIRLQAVAFSIYLLHYIKF